MPVFVESGLMAMSAERGKHHVRKIRVTKLFAVECMAAFHCKAVNGGDRRYSIIEGY